MKRACRLVFVFSSGGIPSTKYQTTTLREGNPCNRVATPSGRNPTTESFDSPRLFEKEYVGKSALPSLSGRNSISGAYRHNSLSENPDSERTDSEWEKSHQWSSFK